VDTCLQKFKNGNSQGLRFARHLLAEAHIDVDDEVDIAVKNGNIIASRAKKKRRRHNLNDLVPCIPENYQTKLSTVTGCLLNILVI